MIKISDDFEPDRGAHNVTHNAVTYDNLFGAGATVN